MTINIGDRVRLRETTYGIPAGSTGTVRQVDSVPSDPQVRVTWDSPAREDDLWLWAARFEPIGGVPHPVGVDAALLEPGDLIEVSASNPGNEGLLSPGARAVVRSLDSNDNLFVRWLDQEQAPLRGPWSPRRFDLPEIRVGRCVRSTGTDQVPAGHLGVVVSLEDAAVAVRWGTLDQDRRAVARDAIRVINPEDYYQRVADFTVEDASPSAETPDAVQEWQKKWTTLVLTAHRIADEHDMCPSFERNVVDLGIPPRGRYSHEVDFDDEGFETPDLVIEDEEVENDYCVDVTRQVQVTVPVTVYVTQYGHVHYTGTDGPDHNSDINWYDVDWSEIDDDAIASSLYNMSNNELRDQVQLEYTEEESAVDGSEEIDNWELSE